MLRAANSIAESKPAGQPAAKRRSGVGPGPGVGAAARAPGPRQPDLEAAVGAARHAGTPARAVVLRGVQHFLESIHDVLLHEEPRRLDASVATGEVAWLGTEMSCGGPK